MSHVLAELARLEELTGRGLEIQEQRGLRRYMVCVRPDPKSLARSSAFQAMGNPAVEFESIPRRCQQGASSGRAADLYAILVSVVAARATLEMFLDSPKFLVAALERVAREI